MSSVWGNFLLFCLSFELGLKSAHYSLGFQYLLENTFLRLVNEVMMSQTRKKINNNTRIHQQLKK